MTITVGIHEGKTQFPRLVSTVEKTLEEVLITRHGKPVARLVPVVDEAARRAEINAGFNAFREEMNRRRTRPPLTEDEIAALIREDRDSR